MHNNTHQIKLPPQALELWQEKRRPRALMGSWVGWAKRQLWDYISRGYTRDQENSFFLKIEIEGIDRRLLLFSKFKEVVGYFIDEIIIVGEYI